MAKEGRNADGTFGKGNLFGTLSKGGGRPSAYAEMNKAKMLEQAVFDYIDMERAQEILVELDTRKKEIKAGKKSPAGRKKSELTLFEIMIAEAAYRNNKLREIIFKKAFPDRIVDESPESSPVEDLIDQLNGEKEA